VRYLLFVALLWSTTSVIPSSMALADAPDVAESLISDAPAGAKRTPEEARSLAVGVASTLRCPVCQGMSVSDSSSNAAVMMYDRIQGQFEEGYSEQQVIDYWVARYGEWVLLAPTERHWIVWLGPIIVGFGGFTWLSFSLFGRKSSNKDHDGSEENTPEEDGSQDPYVAQLLSELED
jgi:cytochrome c-type biogenesis protein CcmH